MMFKKIISLPGMAVILFSVSASLVTASCSDSILSSESESLQPRSAKAASTGIQVTSTSPSAAPRDTTLNVLINGSGFAKGATASFELNGLADARVRVNSTRYVKPTQLVANITISADAVPDRYDVVVTAAGKKGIGTEQFEVTLRAQVLPLGNHAIAINPAGDIVGDGPGDKTCSFTGIPLLWAHDGTTANLPLGGNCGGTTNGINNSGVILGYLSGNSSGRNVLWIPEGSGYSIYELGPTPSGEVPLVRGGINDASEVIGRGTRVASIFWWSMSTGWIDVPVPSGATECAVWDGLNNRGEIVGRCIVGGISNAYYWSSRTAFPLMLPRPGATGDVFAVDINDSGMIAGTSPQGALRWIPVNGTYSSVEVLPSLGYGGQGSEIAEDGTVVGTVNPNGGGGTGNSPAYWPLSGGYRLLGMTLPNSWGDARSAANTGSGLVIVGSEANSKALKWSN
jgi:hypothetical protein